MRVLTPKTAPASARERNQSRLLEHMGSSYGLTEKGYDRLQYFKVIGCPDIACPFCKGKAGYLSCPSCGYQMPRREARIVKETDFVFVVRHAGVYCPRCWKLMFSEAQARLLGIRAEE